MVNSPALGCHWPSPLRAFLHFDDLVGHEAVGLAMHGRRRFLARGLTETEDLSSPLVVPVTDVVDAVLALHGEILLVSLCGHLGGEPVDLAVHVEVERHRGELLVW